MLIANLNGEKVIAENVNNRKQDYTCPNCNGKMLLVKPIANIVDHFRHYVICPHQSEPETIEHLNGKKYLYEIFKDYKPELEKKLSNGQIADLYLKKNNIVIELQCSTISLAEFEKRTEGYEKLGIMVTWILGTKRYLRENINEYGYVTSFRLSIIERELLKKQGSIFYISDDKLKRIFFSDWRGLITRYDIDKEFVVDKKTILSNDETLLSTFPCTKEISDYIHKQIKNEWNEEERKENLMKQQATIGRKKHTYNIYPATDKQIKYLRKLGHSNPEGLNKKEASEWISFFKKESINNKFFSVGSNYADICPLCGKTHNNRYTSYCSSECYNKMIMNHKISKTLPLGDKIVL